MEDIGGVGVVITSAREAEIRRIFEAAGVEFTNGNEPGVKLKQTSRERLV